MRSGSMSLYDDVILRNGNVALLPFLGLTLQLSPLQICVGSNVHDLRMYT